MRKRDADRTAGIREHCLTKENRLSKSKAVAKICMFLIVIVSAHSAYAVDGVAEINHACAETTGCFSGDAAGYPVTIDGSAGASYRLTSSLIVPNENTEGISIDTSGTSIDLNNFQIIRSGCEGTTQSCTSNSGGGSGVRAYSLLHGISVKNGSIVGMGAYGLNLPFQSEVTNVKARWNRLNGIIVGVGSTVSGNSAYENGDDGISASYGCVVSDNAASRNGRDGIRASDGSTVRGNTAYRNAGNGIDTGTGSTITENTAYDNTGDGIEGGSGSTITGNTVYNNAGDGIETGDGVTVQGNTARANAGFGLDLGSESAYRENVVTANGFGSVNGGVNMLGNSCNGTTTCP